MELYKERKEYRIYSGDSREMGKVLSGESIDAIVTDPPYELGFMNRKWDGTGIAYDPSFWAECLKVLKPGGYLLAFGGSHTFHRIACAIEDAGFEIRDTLMWLYGSGFPKSHDLGNGWGTSLKPAYEPIIMARKPFKGSAEQNMLKYGVGGINIDGKYNTTSFTAYVWFVWQKGYKGKPMLDWINVGKDMPKEEALF